MIIKKMHNNCKIYTKYNNNQYSNQYNHRIHNRNNNFFNNYKILKIKNIANKKTKTFSYNH